MKKHVLVVVLLALLSITPSSAQGPGDFMNYLPIVIRPAEVFKPEMVVMGDSSGNVEGGITMYWKTDEYRTWIVEYSSGNTWSEAYRCTDCSINGYKYLSLAYAQLGLDFGFHSFRLFGMDPGHSAYSDPYTTELFWIDESYLLRFDGSSGGGQLHLYMCSRDESLWTRIGISEYQCDITEAPPEAMKSDLPLPERWSIFYPPGQVVEFYITWQPTYEGCQMAFTAGSSLHEDRLDETRGYPNFWP